MGKLLMCRICLVENVRMYVVVNKNLHELYEKLTDVPFVTEDSRPMLACFFCCTKLKQCCRFLRKCLEAEELFAQMMKEDSEAGPSIHRGKLSFYNGFMKTPVETINIVDVGQIAIKDECPAVPVRHHIIESKEGHHSNERTMEIVDISYTDVNVLPAHRSEPKAEYEVPIMKIKTEVEVERESIEPTMESGDNSYTNVRVSPAHHSESQAEYEVPIIDIKIEVEEEQESIGPPVVEKPKLDKRRTKLEDTITAKVFVSTIQNTENRTYNPVTKLEDPVTHKEPEVNKSIHNTASVTSCRKNSNKDDGRKISNLSIDSDNINKHRRLCVQEKPFKCDICQRYFSKKYHLTRHTRIHAGEKPFKCNTCERSFNDNSHLTNHIRIHTGEKPFKCDVCQRSFNQKSHLTSHVRVHSGEEPFKCDTCQRSFNQQCHLRRHIRTHTGEKPFMCDICQRSFSNKSHLTIHMRTHTGERPFKCDRCPRGFNQKIHLTNHVCINAGEELYKCRICHRSFSLKSALTNHINTHARPGKEPNKFILGT